MIIPVILCGGAGARLWPLSRPDEPKPFLPLVEGRSTFALTLDRVRDNPQFGPIVVIANRSHRPRVQQALDAAGINAAVLLEPAPRDTATAIAAAAAFVAGADPFATILVLPADHLIRDKAGFLATVQMAAPVADSGRIVVFGVTPEAPLTTFGYIRPGELIAGKSAAAVDEFIEKPDAARAEELINDGCLWNSGMFLMRAATAQSELDHYAGDIGAAARGAVSQGTGDGNALILARDPFLAAPAISFDHAVMEKTTQAAVVPARFDWSDLGTWETVFAVAGHDSSGNAAEGDVHLVDTHDSYVTTTRSKVGVVGMSGVVVVASDDSVLVTTRDQAPFVKQLAAAIAAAPEKNLGDFVRHYRPWGNYQTIALGARYQVKRIVVDPGQRLSLQRHEHRAERWTVVEGTGEVTLGRDEKSLKTVTVKESQSVDIPRGAVHRLSNRGTTPLVMIEVQMGDYLGEDDIVRFQDDYGRA